jgi:tetratricopeptide (TPR) repeat protein
MKSEHAQELKPKKHFKSKLYVLYFQRNYQFFLKLKENLRFPQIFLGVLFFLALFAIEHQAQKPNKETVLTPKRAEDLIHRAQDAYKERPQEALRLLQQITNPEKLPEYLRGDFHLVKAKSYQVQNKSQACITEALKAEEIMTHANDSSGLMSCYIVKGNAYYHLLALTASAESYIAGMNLAIALRRQDAVTAVTLNLGNIFAQQKDWLRAKQYYKEALDRIEQTKDQSMMSYVLNNLGVTEEMNGKLSKALSYYNKAYKLDVRIKDTLAMMSDLCNRSEVYFKMGRHVQALEGYNQSLTLANIIQNQEFIAQILSKKAECLYRMKGSIDTIEKWCMEAIRMFENKSCQNLLVLRRSHILMAETAAESPNPRRAIQHYKAWRELDSLIMSKESDQRLLEIQATYESEHLQRKTDQLAYERSIVKAQQERLHATNMTLIISILMVTLAAVLVFVWKKQPQPTQKPEKVRVDLE